MNQFQVSILFFAGVLVGAVAAMCAAFPTPTAPSPVILLAVSAGLFFMSLLRSKL